jgi:hypothetical protein
VKIDYTVQKHDTAKCYTFKCEYIQGRELSAHERFLQAKLAHKPHVILSPEEQIISRFKTEFLHQIESKFDEAAKCGDFHFDTKGSNGVVLYKQASTYKIENRIMYSMLVWSDQLVDMCTQAENRINATGPDKVRVELIQISIDKPNDHFIIVAAFKKN